jgi:predicted DCC family thiol-disulfide oxidoreductase YuxK
MVETDSPPQTDACSQLERLPARTIFFDGVCNFCDRSVQWLLAHDTAESFHFAPLQGSTAERLREQLPDFPCDSDSIVYVDATGPEPVIAQRSRAVFAILAQLDGKSRRWTVLRVLPEWLSDLGYRAFARLRYRLFGRLDACVLPSPELRARFLP